MTLDFSQSIFEGKAPFGDAVPTFIHRAGLYSPAVIHLSNGAKTVGSCLRCPFPPCQLYGADELLNDYFEEFPADTSTKVCPTDALQIDTNSGIPIIITDKCICCGLCVARCPVQAITLSEKGAQVNDSQNEIFRLTGKPVNEAQVRAITHQYQSIPINGQIADADFVAKVYGHIMDTAIQSSAQFPNLLVRNLMLSLNVPFHIRRLGDTNMRIDSVFKSGENRLGVAEIEYSDGAILDAPRDTLDDCAVLHARYHIPLNTIDPLIVSSRFPNKRSEYWQVIKDIYEVLGIRIASITVGALLILMWTNQKLVQHIWPELYADADAPTIEPALQKLLICEVDGITAYPGWSRAAK